MEDRQFDTLVKRLAQTRLSRLAVLHGLAASALAGVVGVAFPAVDGAAKRRRRTRHRSKHTPRGHQRQKRHRQRKNQGQGPGAAVKKPKGFERLGKRCDHGQPCGVYTECRYGYCAPIKCWIGNKPVDDGTVNPDNPCQRCNALEHNDAWTRWGTVRDGTTCPPDDSGNPCLSTFIATCQDGVCVTPPLADGTACGDDRVCCGGACCAPGQCCVGVTCQACQCDDGGENLRKGRRNRAAANADCDPACTIDGQTYPDGAANPANPCEVCDSAQDPSAWSPAPFLTKCGANLDQICCHGACCPDGECCRPGFDFCSVEWCGIVDPCPYLDGPCGCTIDGQFSAHQAVNPTNECEWCDAYWSTDAWTSRPSHVRCGPFADRFCCEGVCCETGACCNAAEVCEAGAPGCRGCTIGGRFSFNGHQNPDDPCQQCVTTESTTSWSHAPNGNTCEAVIDDNGVYWGDRVCCEGVCCELYACCNRSGVCEQTTNCQ